MVGTLRFAHPTDRMLVRSLRLRPVRREEHARRAVDDASDLLGRRGGLVLEDERLEQRRLAHLHELPGGELIVVDRELAELRARLEIGCEAVDRGGDHLGVEPAANLRHPFGDRHHGTDRGSPAGPAQQADIGPAELGEGGVYVAAGVEIEGGLALFELFFFDDRLEQAVLVGKVNVECPFGDSGGAGDLAHAGAVKTQIHEDLTGSVQDLAALRALLVTDDLEGMMIGCNHRFSFSRKIRAGETLSKRRGPNLPLANMYIDRTVRSMVIWRCAMR